ncbi:acid protease [Polychaeton citri CBS 116435]|uniref:Acid protease n=1 Tax=Polychaeton citri CBS 116435 TaxID=1314669 RepID=A0A9P4QBN2_9PEZI|nr:acid protease [Polychaeton citri CBS 116435]
MKSTSAGLSGIFAWLALLEPIFSATAISIPSLSDSLGEPLLRRDGNATKIPAAVSVAPSQYWDGIDGPWSSFALQVGPTNKAQNVRALISTVAYNTWTIGPDGCNGQLSSDCADSRGGIFYPNQSLSYVANSIYNVRVEDNLGLDTSGPVGFDTVTLGWQGAGGPSMDHSVVFNIFSIYLNWVGVFGINPLPTNFSNFVDPQPSFMTHAYQNSIIPSIAYGYTAGNQYQLDGLKIFGSLTLGGYDQNRFVSNNISFPMGSDISRDLIVNLVSITTDKGTPSNLLPDGQVQIFIDSTVSQIWLPQSACEAFEDAFGITYDNTTGYYLIDATQRQALLQQDAKVTLTIQPYNAASDTDSTVDIVMPYGAFDLNISWPYIGNNLSASSYYFPLRRAENNTQYTLGRAFLQEAYLIADYQRSNFSVSQCDWDASTINQQDIRSILSPNLTEAAAAAQSSHSSSSSLTGGEIAGVIVGVVGGVAIIGAGLFLWRRRRSQAAKRKAQAELDEKAAAEAADGKSSSDADGNEGTHLKISRPLGGELGGGEISEMDAPHKHFAQELDSPYKLDDPNKAGYSEMEGGSGYFEPGKNGRVGASEMQGSTPIFEMAGSEVQELPGSQAYGRRVEK